MALYREQMLALSYHSMAAFPLRIDDRTIGVINFYSNEREFFNDEEAVLLEELAMDISYALRSLDIEKQRIMAEKELQNERNLLRTVIDNIPDLIHVKDTACRTIIANLADVHFIGANKEEEVIGKNDFDFYPHDIAAQFFEDDQTIIQSGQSIIDREQFLFDKEGQKRWLLISKLPLKDEQWRIIGLVGIGRNITEQKKMHDQLIQAQKVQSIGTLAGGIAHDFNNILGIILAYSSLLERSSGDKEKILKSAVAITQAVGRGAALVRQILAFARQTVVLMKPMSIPDLINELMIMLKETFPKVIEFQTNIEKNLPFINADYTQMHQVMLNLCVNARDAMPHGGLISIEVKTIPFTTLVQQFPEAKNECYISIKISDTGMGMDAETKSRIYDPFFTTKAQGKGTGLGLSVVYGVIQEHHGFISVESTLGHGTTFFLYLPAQQEKEKKQEVKVDQSERLKSGTETILFVEDEDLLRDVVQSTLESNGYTVFIATSGREAVEIYKKQQINISLVLTDMGLPKLTGIDEFVLLKEINPKVKVIFASGFISIETRSELLKEGAKGFILKPYNITEVLQMIREVLDEKEE
jgi:PAS domain S-box-containing protein